MTSRSIAIAFVAAIGAWAPQRVMRGKPFAKDDWAVIAPDGKLKDGVRASAWACRDGRNPIIDWERPSG